MFSKTIVKQFAANVLNFEGNCGKSKEEIFRPEAKFTEIRPEIRGGKDIKKGVAN